MSEDTRTGLLEAAERILIEDGVHALTVRRVGIVSGLNSTLITYHFGTVAGLLAELCRLNLEPMLKEWESLDSRSLKGRSLEQVLEAWLGPLIRPSVFTPGGRSLVVFDEIASHGDPALSEHLLTVMRDISARVQAALRTFVPHLTADELRARVRFISAGALGPPPRARISADVSRDGKPLDGLFYLVLFAKSALLGEARKKMRTRKTRPEPVKRAGQRSRQHAL